MTQAQWKSLMGNLNLAKQMAAQHDAAFVLIAAGEVKGEATPRAAWVTSGVTDETSIARSEATIAMLEHATRELRKAHRERFGKEPQPRGYKPK